MHDVKRAEAVRDTLLKVMYSIYLSAESQFQIKRPEAKIVKMMREQYQVEKAEVARNLQYLVDEGFVKKEQQEWKVGTNISHYDVFFLSNDAIRLFEGDTSKYKKQSLIAQNINVSNRDGVVAIGNEIVVNQKFESIASDLDQLVLAVKSSQKLSAEVRKSIESDVTTIKAQLMKAKPDKTIIKSALGAIRGLVTAEGLIQLSERIEQALSSIGLL